MEKYKNIYILVATFIIIALALDKCTTETIPVSDKVEVISTKTIVDSMRTHYTRHIDSTLIWAYHSYTEVPEIEQDGVMTPSSSFSYTNTSDDRIDLSDTSELFNDVNTFYYGKKDSSLNYTIKVTGEVKPVKVEMEYELLKLMIKDY